MLKGSARERLRMEMVTDGSITPDDALAQSANQLIELFQPLATVTLVEEVPVLNRNPLPKRRFLWKSSICRFAPTTASSALRSTPSLT